MIEKMYALVNPKGRIIKETVRPTKDQVWEVGFWCVPLPSFVQTYWKKWDESIAAAKKKGYVIKRVKVVVE